MGSLTAVQLRNLKSAGRYSDGDGLMLIVRESGKASWIARVQYNGRRRDIGIGAFPDLSLSKAREIAADVRRKSKAGIDIVTERKKEKEIVPTFRVAARQVHANHANRATLQRFRSKMFQRSSRHCLSVCRSVDSLWSF